MNIQMCNTQTGLSSKQTHSRWAFINASSTLAAGGFNLSAFSGLLSSETADLKGWRYHIHRTAPKMWKCNSKDNPTVRPQPEVFCVAHHCLQLLCEWWKMVPNAMRENRHSCWIELQLLSSSTGILLTWRSLLGILLGCRTVTSFWS